MIVEMPFYVCEININNVLYVFCCYFHYYYYRGNVEFVSPQKNYFRNVRSDTAIKSHCVRFALMYFVAFKMLTSIVDSTHELEWDIDKIQEDFFLALLLFAVSWLAAFLDKQRFFFLSVNIFFLVMEYIRWIIYLGFV